MEYRHQALSRLINRMPLELREKIILHYWRVMQNTAGQAQKLQWVIYLGGGPMGLEAYKLLLEAVTIWNIENGDSFFTSGEPTSFLGHLFNTDMAGNFTTPFGYVKSLYLAFDFRLIEFTSCRPFPHAFPLTLGLFHDLQSFTITISAIDANRSFFYITSFDSFPPSLKVVRIIASSTLVRMMFSDVAGADTVMLRENPYLSGSRL
jgi:hypothetical protein